MNYNIQKYIDTKFFVDIICGLLFYLAIYNFHTHEVNEIVDEEDIEEITIKRPVLNKTTMIILSLLFSIVVYCGYMYYENNYMKQDGVDNSNINQIKSINETLELPISDIPPVFFELK